MGWGFRVEGGELLDVPSHVDEASLDGCFRPVKRVSLTGRLRYRL